MRHSRHHRSSHDAESRFAHGPFARHRERERDHGHRRGGRRLFDHGDLRFVILQLIADKPRHGYELIKAIEEKAGGSYSPSPGVIYPTLTLLEELGYTAALADAAGKKRHEITPEGQALLDANRPTVDAIFARVADLGGDEGDGPAPQILRAMHNLRLALRIRLVREGLSEEQRRRITAILDAAARDIEQS
jgi:DNA-binding PadR family transcriptional regulator